MADRKKMGPQMKIYLREESPAHKMLRRRCDDRDRDKYKTPADYLAAAVSKLESLDTITLTVDLNNLNEEARDAVMVLMKYKVENNM